ncbi:hypothetical protein AgCh_015002 [Apium graveolens]
MATTSNLQLAAPCSSTSYSLPPTWDVFLSFCGKDTRGNFTSHLYSALVEAGIRTFMDDPELNKGAEISPGLSNAICGSNIFIVVLSENYASSRWCLDELVEILACKRTNGLLVIPVFLYVDPSDVRHQRKSFGKGLESQKNSHSVDKWKSALAEIADLSGHHLEKDANENESNTVKKIVEKVTQLISTKLLDLDGYLVGTGSFVQEIYLKLCMESNDVRAIGICGMGGIGKTTIAKGLYNKYFNNFDISCFIDDVKQLLQGGSPLLALLQQLLNKLTGRKEYKVSDIKNGLRHLQQILDTKKALIVLDDLDQPSYSELLVRLCNLFSAGSRIIFTTRDAHLANQLKEDISEVDIYMMRKLGEADSLELFSYYAFRKPTPPESFKELTLSFITYAGGLPLALKVLGSSLLRRTDVAFWKEKLVKVQEIGEIDIQRILKMSYDELGDETPKAIFLDIAFFFVGRDKDEAVHVFRSCGFFPDVGIPILEERCLLIVDEHNKFQMHNLIQQMGKEVIRQESDAGNCRCLNLRLGNACMALQNLEGSKNIEGLIIDLTMSTKGHFATEIFESLPNLRLLEIVGACDIKGNFDNSFYELRCFRWHRCPWTQLPSSFRPQKLVSLDMPYSELKTLWKGTKPFLNLKTINLSYSEKLKVTPNFTNLRLVEKLLLRGCRSLLQVHRSIEQLTNLSYLDLGECSHLTELPIAQLTKLGHLDLHWCVNLKRLPELIIQLNTLGSLNLSHCRNLTQLPEQLGDMKCLKMLNASYTLIEHLPDSIGHLKELVDLKLCNCKKLRKLPEQIGNLESLKLFDASCSAIEHLPDTFAGLIKLDKLDLNWCKKLVSLPNSLWKLKVLRVLNVSEISKLEQLPEQLGKMQCLEELYTLGTNIEALPDSIGLLSSLKILHLPSPKNLPSSIWNLTSLTILSLHLGDKDEINSPDMVQYMKLKTLNLTCNASLWWPLIISFSSLESLTLFDERQSFSPNESYSLYKLSKLRSLTLFNCTSHECCFSKLPPNLTYLSINGYATLKMLPDLSSLKQLGRLYVRRCISLQALPPLPPHLKHLEVDECTRLQDLPDLSMLKELTHLNFGSCINLKSISLKQSFLQVGQIKLNSFEADIPNKEVGEWFSYKSSGNTLSFTIPPNLGDNLFGVGLWIVCKHKHTTVRSSLYVRAVITNRTKDIKNNYDIYIPWERVVGEVQSRLQCIKNHTMESGDRIKISFQCVPHPFLEAFKKCLPRPDSFTDSQSMLKVKKCGAHLIRASR